MDDLFIPRESSSPDAVQYTYNFQQVTLPPIHTVPGFSTHRSAGVRNHLDTLRDVESAFHNADIALRHAREALRSDAIMSSRLGSASASNTGNNHGNGTNGNSDGNNVVDLTTLSSDTSNEDPEVQWSHTRHPSDSRPRGWRTGGSSHIDLDTFPHSAFGAVGAFTHFRPHPYIYPPHPNHHRVEETAIRRQRQARRDWERVERRNAERAAVQAQRDANEQARRLADQATADNLIANRDSGDIRTRRYSSDSSTSSISILSNESRESQDTDPTVHQNTQGTTNSADTTTDSMPHTQSIDLTTLDDQPSLKDKILSQQQQAAIAAQKISISASKDPKSELQHTTPLSSYRCAICMDTPTTATTTICGHLFCHTCLKDSLKWSAQQRRDEATSHGRRAPTSGTGLCPVCRKLLSDKESGSKAGIVGLEIKAVNRKEWERRKKQEKDDKEREDFLLSLTQRTSESEKGKEREQDSDSYVKAENQSDGAPLGSSRLTRGHVTRKRRRDEGAAYENHEGF